MNLRKIITTVLVAALTVTASYSQNLIKAGRVIQVSIKGVPVEEQAKIDGQYAVSDSGLVSLPYLSSPIRAAGLTPGALAANIQASYKSQQIYRSPAIQVFASTADALDKQMVHIGGYVRNPGPVEFNQGLTLYQAVQAAGGATEFGSMKRVSLYRAGKQQTYNLNLAQFKNIPLQPSDTVEVPQKTITGQ